MGIIQDSSGVSSRGVPVTLCLQALFGGALNQFGWIFFGFGMIFVWVFGGHSEVTTYLRFAGPLQTAQGTVVRSFNTHASENETDIYGIDYTFTPNGQSTAMKGTSYALGREIAPGTAVTVEYRADHTDYSRIQGLRSAEFGPFVIIVLIFPLFGLGMLIANLRRSIPAVRLLYTGIPAAGTLVFIDKTNTKVNKRPVYQVIFEFDTRQGTKSRACLYTTNLEPAWEAFNEGGSTPQALVEDEFITQHSGSTVAAAPQEVVLYDPANPRTAFLPAEYGRGIHVDRLGEIRGANPAVGIAATIIPLITVLGHGWYVVRHLVK
ncbi:MAG: DUF3592 domain-containing protein [Armatimonadota bacterium]